MAVSGAVPRKFTPEQFADYIVKDHARWGRIVRAANISAE
jgi:tripartite-type tricarboxylate transporter receptor subunit TctC